MGTSPGSKPFDNLVKDEAMLDKPGSIAPWDKRHKPSRSAAKTPRTWDLSWLSSLSISDLWKVWKKYTTADESYLKES